MAVCRFWAVDLSQRFTGLSSETVVAVHVHVDGTLPENENPMQELEESEQGLKACVHDCSGELADVSLGDLRTCEKAATISRSSIERRVAMVELSFIASRI